MRSRLTYANVMATIAVFIALGGASYAAIKLPKNSVGPKQLKKNAVTTAKVRNEAITAAKVKKGALTGTEINASTLGTVPTADRANTAGTANSLPAPEPWHEIGRPGQPAFRNEWSNFGSGTASVAFYRDAQSVVHLKGTLSGSNDATTAFVLPAGFRPLQVEYFPTTGKQPSPEIGVYPSGEVKPVCEVSGCFPSLNGISFRAES